MNSEISLKDKIYQKTGIVGAVMLGFLSYTASHDKILFSGVTLTCFMLMMIGLRPYFRKICRVLAKDKLTWFILVVAAYVVLRAVFANYGSDYLTAGTLRGTVSYLEIGGLLAIPIGVWLAIHGFRKPILLMTALCFISFIVVLLVHFDWTNPVRTLSGRPALGVWPTVYGCIAAVFLFALLSYYMFFPIQRGNREIVSKYRLWSFRLLVLVGILMAGQILIISQTRAAWLAVVIVLVIMLMMPVLSGGMSRILSGRFHKTSNMMLFIVILALFLLNGPMIWHRAADDMSFLISYINNDIVPADPNSINLRFALWRVGLQSWIENWLFGYGPGSVVEVISQYDSPELSHLIHLHSLYLQPLVEIGLVGALGLGIILLSLCIRMKRAWEAGLVHNDIFLGWVSAVAVILIVGIFGWRIEYGDYRLVFVMLGAVAYAAHLSLLMLDI